MIWNNKLRLSVIHEWVNKHIIDLVGIKLRSCWRSKQVQIKCTDSQNSEDASKDPREIDTRNSVPILLNVARLWIQDKRVTAKRNDYATVLRTSPIKSNKNSRSLMQPCRVFLNVSLGVYKGIKRHKLCRGLFYVKPGIIIILPLKMRSSREMIRCLYTCIIKKPLARRLLI